jgi:hypothetical protein
VSAPAPVSAPLAEPAAEQAETEAVSDRVSRRDLVENPRVQTVLRVFKGRIVDIQQGRPDAGL